MKEDHVSCLFKDVRINKAFWTSLSNTYTLKGILFFIVDYYESYFFSARRHLPHYYFSKLFCFLMHVWTQHVSSNVLPCWFLVNGKPTVWLFYSWLIPEDQTKKLRDAMAAYLLCRSNAYKQAIILISWYDFIDVKDVPLFTSRFSSGLILLE